MTNEHERGLTLVETIVAGSLLALAALAAVNLFSKSIDIQGALDRDSQKKVLQRMIRENMDCRNSLGIKPDTVPPVTCGKDYVLRLRNGEELFPETDQKDIKRTEQWASISDWQLRSRCENKEHLLVEVRLAKRDALNPHLSEWHDLFSGHSRLCREYFAPSMMSCSQNKIYSVIGGFDTAGAQCCRLQEAVGASESRAQCGATEFSMHGGSECSNGSSQSLAGLQAERHVVDSHWFAMGAGVAKVTIWPALGSGDSPHTHVYSSDVYLGFGSPFKEVYKRKRFQMGGFIQKSLPFVLDSQGTVSGWIGACKSFDGKRPYPSRSWTLCCPKK